MGFISFSVAQVPRGETSESITSDSESPLGFLLIFAVIAVFSAFRRSKAEGMKVLGFCVGVVLLAIFLPKIGMVIVGLLGLVIVWGLFQSMM